MRALFVTLAVIVSGVCFAEVAGGLEWKAPQGWALQPARPMRAATYLVPAEKGDAEPAELGIFYFGPGEGGAAQANIDRWVGQFELPDGGPATKAAKTTKEKNAAGLKITRVDLTGTYLAPVGGPMSAQKERKKDFRLLGAIVEGPEGSVFFKMTGPKKTVGKAKADFDKLMKSLGPAAKK